MLLCSFSSVGFWNSENVPKATLPYRRRPSLARPPSRLHTEAMRNAPSLKAPHIEASPTTDAGALRDEIVASQEARTDLLKYKLLAVAALGAIGLGYSDQPAGHPSFEPVYVLCVIPFVCAFVDLICWHNTLRILVIGRYLASTGDQYEGFLDILGKRIDGSRCAGARRPGARYFFELEDWALQWSSLVLSLLLLLFGTYRVRVGMTDADPMPLREYVFVVSGVSGATLALVVWRVFSRRVKHLYQFTPTSTLD